MFGTDPRSSGGKETNIALKGAQRILYVETSKTPKIPVE